MIIGSGIDDRSVELQTVERPWDAELNGIVDNNNKLTTNKVELVRRISTRSIRLPLKVAHASVSKNHLIPAFFYAYIVSDFPI